MQLSPLTSMTANEIKSLDKDGLNAALSLTNTQASTSLTTEDVKAALILVDLSAPSTDGPVTPIYKSNDNFSPNGGQAREIDSQRGKRGKNFKHQHQQPKMLPKDRRAEYRRYIARETDAHREERLRKSRQRAKAKREKAKREKAKRAE